MKENVKFITRVTIIHVLTYCVCGDLSTTFRLKNIVLPLCCYIVLAIMPTIYNYVMGSVFASLLTLGINVIPVIVIFPINFMAERHSKED